MPKGKDSVKAQQVGAAAGLALGLLMALAANLTYAIPRGPVVIGIGLIAPLVLPIVLWMRTTFTANKWWQKGLREISMLAVAGPAVAISYSHTYSLVLESGEPWLIAVLAPLSSDGVAGMSTMALHWSRSYRQEATRKSPAPRVPSKPSTTQSETPTSSRSQASVSVDELMEIRRRKDAERKRIARAKARAERERREQRAQASGGKQ